MNGKKTHTHRHSPVYRRIRDLLMDRGGEMPIGSLCAATNMPRTTLLAHLKHIEEIEIVDGIVCLVGTKETEEDDHGEK